MKLEEISLGKDNEDKREAVQDNLGKQVIICNSNNQWCHGVLLEGCYDGLSYRIKLYDDRKQMVLTYNDLKKILVIKNTPEDKKNKSSFFKKNQFF